MGIGPRSSSLFLKILSRSRTNSWKCKLRTQSFRPRFPYRSVLRLQQTLLDTATGPIAAGLLSKGRPRLHQVRRGHCIVGKGRTVRSLWDGQSREKSHLSSSIELTSIGSKDPEPSSPISDEQYNLPVKRSSRLSKKQALYYQQHPEDQVKSKHCTKTGTKQYSRENLVYCVLSPRASYTVGCAERG